MAAIQKYPIGLQDFEKIRTQDYIYIDKTYYIENLINNGSYYFLSRPRRFGKSLLISTLECLFLGKKDLFKGLFIEDKWDFDQKFPVIRISFSDIGYREIGLEKAIELSLRDNAQKYEVSFEAESISQQFKELIHKLHAKFKQQVVVLIDEYDKPIIDYLEKENIYKAKENRGIMKSFYSILKDADPHLKLVFITGISKFSQVSIFSDLNNLFDLTTHYAYNSICGITQNELETSFEKELIHQDKEKIKTWYNGYKWDLDCETVYNPFSLLNFFSQGCKYKTFWFTTGTPSFLIDICRSYKLYDIENTEISELQMASFDIENINIEAVMFQAGYLTIISKSPIFNIYTLSYPNEEVKSSFLSHLLNSYLEDKSDKSSRLLTSLMSILQNRELDKLHTYINTAFSSIPYDLWQKENEHFYHAIIHLLFRLMGVYIQSEVHVKDGRADALIQIEEGIFCMEFKLDKSAQEALDQIKNKGYLNEFKHLDKPCYAIGINFSSQEKKVEEIIWELM